MKEFGEKAAYKMLVKLTTGYYSFGHEIAHMYGCDHNREVSQGNSAYPNAHGFLMNPPVNSGLRTIMA